MRAMLEGRLAQFTAQLAALRRQQQESAELEVGGTAAPACLVSLHAPRLPAAAAAEGWPHRLRSSRGMASVAEPTCPPCDAWPQAQAASLASLGVGGSPTVAPAAAVAASTYSSRAASPAASRPSSAAATPRGGSEALSAAMEAAAVRYVSLITAGLCQWLPEYWALTQQRLPALASIGDAAPAVERGMAAAERSVAALLRQYRSAVQAVLADPSGAGLSHSGLLAIAADLAGCCEALHAAPAGGASGVAALSPPPAAVECLQQLTEQALLGSLAQLAAHLSAAVAALCAAEDFCLTGASRRTGAPATASVSGLQQLVQQGMQHLQAALGLAARAEVQPLRTSAAPAGDAFFGCFSAFAAGTDALAASLLQDPARGLAGGGGGAGAPTAGSSHHQARLGSRFMTASACA